MIWFGFYFKWKLNQIESHIFFKFSLGNFSMKIRTKPNQEHPFFYIYIYKITKEFDILHPIQTRGLTTHDGESNPIQWMNEWEKGLENDHPSPYFLSLLSLLWSSLFLQLYFSLLCSPSPSFSLLFLFISSKGGARTKRSAQWNNILHHEGNSFRLAKLYLAQRIHLSSISSDSTSNSLN